MDRQVLDRVTRGDHGRSLRFCTASGAFAGALAGGLLSVVPGPLEMTSRDGMIGYIAVFAAIGALIAAVVAAVVLARDDERGAESARVTLRPRR